MTNKTIYDFTNKKEHNHPFAPFITDNTTTLILGTFPGKNYTDPCIKTDPDDWYYGNKNNKFWKIIEYAFDCKNPLNTKTDKQNALAKNNIGITDIIQKARRKQNNNSDENLDVTEIRNLNAILEKYPNITAILLTSKDMYTRFFTRYYVKTDGAVLYEIKREEKYEQNLKIDIYHYTFNGRLIRVIPLHSPARETISTEIKKKIYKWAIKYVKISSND